MKRPFLLKSCDAREENNIIIMKTNSPTTARRSARGEPIIYKFHHGVGLQLVGEPACILINPVNCVIIT